MNKDEALDLALETLESIQAVYPCETVEKRITAIKQARALDKKAENARELGLDYEPPCKTGSQCTSKCEQCVEPAQPAPVQDQVTLIQTNVGIGERAMEAYEASKERDRAARSAPTVQEPVCQKCGGTGEVEEGGVYPSGDLAYVPCECATQPAAQRQWVGLTQTEVDECYESVMFNPDIEPTRVLVYQAIEAKLKERNV